MSICVFPGSFDPITNGHLDIIHKCCKLFDKVYICVLINYDKLCAFSVDERVHMIEKATKEHNNVVVKSFDGLLVDFAKKNKADYIVRGVRNSIDYSYESSIAKLNACLDETIETLIFFSGEENSFISSTIVKELCAFEKDVSKFVPNIILNDIKNKLNKRGR